MYLYTTESLSLYSLYIYVLHLHHHISTLYNTHTHNTMIEHVKRTLKIGVLHSKLKFSIYV